MGIRFQKLQNCWACQQQHCSNGSKKREKPAEIIGSPPEILDTGEEMRKLRKDNDRLKEKVEILKSYSVLCKGEPVRYAWIYSH